MTRESSKLQRCKRIKQNLLFWFWRNFNLPKRERWNSVQFHLSHKNHFPAIKTFLPLQKYLKVNIDEEIGRGFKSSSNPEQILRDLHVWSIMPCFVKVLKNQFIDNRRRFGILLCFAHFFVVNLYHLRENGENTILIIVKGLFCMFVGKFGDRLGNFVNFLIEKFACFERRKLGGRSTFASSTPRRHFYHHHHLWGW